MNLCLHNYAILGESDVHYLKDLKNILFTII